MFMLLFLIYRKPQHNHNHNQSKPSLLSGDNKWVKQVHLRFVSNRTFFGGSAP